MPKLTLQLYRKNLHGAPELHDEETHELVGSIADEQAQELLCNLCCSLTPREGDIITVQIKEEGE